MKIRWSCLLFAVILVMGFNATAGAASFPTKTITMYTSSSPGGGGDLPLRMLAKAMSSILGQPVVVENKVGGGGFLTGSAIASAKPDGYTLGQFYTSGFTMAPLLRNPPYDIFTFTPVASYGMYVFEFTVRQDSPWKTFQDFIGYAKQHPNVVTVSTCKPDSMENLPIWMLQNQAGIKVKLVPLEEGPSVTSLLGGHVMALTGVGQGIPMIREGKLRMLATYLGQRMATFPDVPTLKELGYNIVVESVLAMYAPPGTPKDVVQILEDAFRKASNDADFKKIISNYEIMPVFRSASEIDKYHRTIAAEAKPIMIKLGMVKK